MSNYNSRHSVHGGERHWVREVFFKRSASGSSVLWTLLAYLVGGGGRETHEEGIVDTFVPNPRGTLIDAI